MDEEEGRAAIWEIDPQPASTASSPRACAIRVGMAWEPETGALWTVVNERDELGSDLVPDYMTSVRDGGFYGWPYSYFGQHVDARVKPPRPDLVAKAIVPDYALGRAHRLARPRVRATARRPAAALRERRVRRPARLVEPQAAQRLQGDLRAVRRRQAGGRAGRRADRLRRATTARRTAGRSASRSTRRGALLVADDVGNAIWRVTAAEPGRGSRSSSAAGSARDQSRSGFGTSRN